jgi:hypothetical protein
MTDTKVSWIYLGAVFTVAGVSHGWVSRADFLYRLRERPFHFLSLDYPRVRLVFAIFDAARTLAGTAS